MSGFLVLCCFKLFLEVGWDLRRDKSMGLGNDSSAILTWLEALRKGNRPLVVLRFLLLVTSTRSHKEMFFGGL